MAEKKSTKKTEAKKPRYATLEPQKEEEVSEPEAKEEVVEEVVEKQNDKKVPQRIEVQIMVEGRFSRSNLDELAATYAFSETTNELYIKDGQNGACGADIENIFDSDLLIIDEKTQAKRVVSKTETPKLWLTSLYEGFLGRPYKALESTTHDETE
jgi:hypothetical protein